MHKRILSNYERKLLDDYLTTGKTSNSFRMLKLRIKKNFVEINQDFDLIKKAKESFST